MAYKQSYRCSLCDKLLPPLFHVDHINPLHRGGADDWRTNMQAVCPDCHAAKSCEEVLQLIEGDELYTLAAIHEEHINPNGEHIFLCDWVGYRSSEDFNWESAFNLENEEVFLEEQQQANAITEREIHIKLNLIVD